MQQKINCITQVSSTHDITGLLMQQHINCNSQVSATHDSTGWGLVDVMANYGLVNVMTN